MRRVEKPSYDARFSLKLCASCIRDGAFSKRLLSVTPEIESAEVRYKERGVTESLFTIPESKTVMGIVDVKEMEKLYENTFSRKGSPPRRIYDEIKISPRNGICPLCGQRVVSTLDHYLAKSRHPALAITPVNLVPACSECNKVKSNLQPTCGSAQTLHPYFDDVDDLTWLFAKVIEDTPPALFFSAVPSSSWPDLKRERVIHHFQTFCLGALYSSHAAEELVNIRDYLRRIADRLGPGGLRDFLVEQAECRRRITNNDWQVAMYDALSNSEWFCNDGYKRIP